KLGCARTASGEISCWGDPTAVAEASAAFARHDRSIPRVLRASQGAMCAITRSGASACVLFTEPRYRESMALIEQELARIAGISDIRVGSDHACAVVRGAAWCWGSNTFEQLGFEGDDAPEPVRVSLGDLASLRAARAVSVSSTHRCVLGLD